MLVGNAESRGTQCFRRTRVRRLSITLEAGDILDEFPAIFLRLLEGAAIAALEKPKALLTNS